MFAVAYRCRDCNRRELHRTPMLLIGAAFAAVLAISFVVGIAIGNLGNEPPTSAAPAARKTTVGAQASVPASASASPLPGDDLPLAETVDAGDAKAQLRLGLAFMNGNGVQRNSTTALAWIERAAKQGDAEAQFVLGDLHLTGCGALQSFPLALLWFQKSAQQNNADAQYSLGQMLRLGHGAAVDKAKAYFWFNLAAAQGHEGARRARDGLLSSLTTEQVVDAQRAALEWRPDVAQK